MAYGLEIFTPGGALWASPDVTPINFIEKLRFSNGTVTTSVPANKAIIFFVHHDSAPVAQPSCGVFTQRNAGGVWAIDINTSHSAGDLYVFSNFIRPQDRSGMGIATYAANGEMLWNTNMRPLQTILINNPYGINHTTNYSINAGFPVAVNPGIASTWIAPENPAAGSWFIGAIAAGANGNTIYGGVIKGGITGGGFPKWKYKENFICIDIRKYQ